MKVATGGIILALIVELILVPAVDGACAGTGCVANIQGVEMLHCLAIGFALGGPAVSICEWWSKKR